MEAVNAAPGRAWHKVRPNEQSRMPHRWIAFDSEARRHRHKGGETQTWRLGVAVRWRTDLKSGQREEWIDASTPEALWDFVVEHCHPNHRTVIWAHNLAYDLRITRALEILPRHGFTLAWW